MNSSVVDPRPVGVFDSGIGGLTVAASIHRILPQEDIVYLGDLLHLPYGSKSPKAVVEFSRAAVRFLVSKGVKLLVVACNTATSIAMEEIQEAVDVPVIGVIGPGARAACGVSRNGKIGVIGTLRTIESRAYERAILSCRAEAAVFQRATPLLVPLIEENWIGHSVMRAVLDEYFLGFRETGMDTLVLGCTHYPLIKGDIESSLGGVRVVDSARTTAEAAREMLSSRGALNGSGRGGSYRLYLTDYTETFRQIGERIIGRDRFDARVVDLEYTDGTVSYR